MNDDATLTAVRDRFREVRGSLVDVHMDTTASEIFASAKKRRSRRVLAAAGAACTAIGIAVALAVPAGQARPVHVHLAAWSVDTNLNGTVTFKLRNTSQPSRLQHVLAEAGVPAMVRRGEICLAQGRHVLLPTQGIVKVTGPTVYVNGRPTQPGSVFLLMGGHGAGGKPLNWSWTIAPAKIPQGARFVISAIPGNRVSPDHIQAAWEFVPASAPVTCAKSVKP
jgi:hypothetical protein